MAAGLALFAVVTLSAPVQPIQRFCAIDMGSNSFRRIVGSFERGSYQQTRIDVITMGVGDDVARNGRISESKLAEIRQALATFKRACEKDGATRMKAIGTAAFRDAPNGQRVVDAAAALGIEMEIATERRESELAYLVGSLGSDGYAVVDNGSRSIELVSRQDGATRYVVVNLGYRVAYETFFARADSAERAAAAFRDRLAREASRASFMTGKRALVALEFGEMADVFFPSTGGRPSGLTVERLKLKLREITALSADGFTALKAKKDIDRALPRLVVAVFLLDTFGYSELQLVDRELGAGLIIEASK